MKNKKKIIAIIPAKGVSKRIPNKNIKDLAGQPMIAYIIKAALKSKYLDRIIVSTESEKIAKVAKKYGAEVPFKRPKELTLDHVPTLDVLRHALKELAKKENYVPEYVMLLYTTSPLLKTFRIDQAIEMAIERDSDSVFSGTYDKKHYWREVEGGYERLYPLKQVVSQLQIPLVKENGAIYLSKTEILKKQYVADKADALIMDEEENIDVDYPEDFAKVEKILSGK
jgi:N-acylneuraminate cytidylyltransferase/CMP-N,N'-diacetyllegionaminic acid synthase